MTWNYRVVREPNDSYSIYEAYYDKESDKAHSITEYPVSPYGDSYEELRKNMTQMMEAFTKPVLNYEDF